jgi:hypothetical protein
MHAPRQLGMLHDHMDIAIQDFNSAAEIFEGQGAAEWADLEGVLQNLETHLQPSGQRGITGTPIFDPKGTNAALNAAVKALGWITVPVPTALTMFGTDWDAGKGCTLAEWQFSNYPFLWNNVIRTQAVVTGQVSLQGVGTTSALVVVAKTGSFPASQSTLYFEQARAQLEAVFSLGAFSLPVRLIGLMIPAGVTQLPVVWSTYAGRTSRTMLTREKVEANVTWGTRPSGYGTLKATFRIP